MVAFIFNPLENPCQSNVLYLSILDISFVLVYGLSLENDLYSSESLFSACLLSIKRTLQIGLELLMCASVKSVLVMVKESQLSALFLMSDDAQSVCDE